MPSPKIAALVIERRPLGDLRPHPRNPRVHPKEGSPAWEILKRSLDHDYFDPMVWNRRNGLLVSGHFRAKVLAAAGYTDADVSVVDYDEETHLARLIAANELLGAFEKEILASLARDLDTAGIDAALAGWDEQRIAELLDGPQVSDDTARAGELVDDAAALQERWKVRPGELFEIGRHRLICGDCTKGDGWLRLIGDRKGDAVWTDPPYNVDYVGSAGGMLNDSMSDEAYLAFLRAAFQRAHDFTRPGAAIYVAHADSEGEITRQAFREAGWRLAQCLVWVKGAFTLGRQDYQWQHEPILYGWKPGAAHYWQGGFCQSTAIDEEETRLAKRSKADLIAIIQALRNARDTTVIREPKNAANGLHPTIKPLPLVARQIHNSTRKGDIVVECFNGSGTTIFAAEQTGRVAVAHELDPRFVAVTLQRAVEAGLPIQRFSHEAAA